jgi:hypothetical protein
MARRAVVFPIAQLAHDKYPLHVFASVCVECCDCGMAPTELLSQHFCTTFLRPHTFGLFLRAVHQTKQGSESVSAESLAD